MKKKALAIPLVLVFATIMGIVSLFLLRSAKSYNRQNLTSFNQLQSYFIARAGVEHAMLKIKFLNRELYDAICLSQGRNPLFDFSLIESKEKLNDDDLKSAIKTYNPGPIFLYPAGKYENSGVFTKNFNDPKSEDSKKHNQWIYTYLSDLKSVSNTELNIKNTIDEYMRDDFINAQYEVLDIGVSASEVKEETKKVVNSVVVEFTVKSSLETARNESFDYEIKKTVRVSRD